MIRIVQKKQIGPRLYMVWHDSDELESPVKVEGSSNRQIRLKLEAMAAGKVGDERVEAETEEDEVTESESKSVEVDEPLPENFTEVNGEYRCLNCGFSTTSRSWVTRHADCGE
jgi:hypothetical protein